MTAKKVYSRVMFTAFLTSGFSSQAANLDPNGLQNDPLCDSWKVIRSVVMEGRSELPTGLKSSVGNWSLEIYNSAKTGTWTVVGLAKDMKSEREMDKACVFLSGTEKLPYEKEKFFIVLKFSNDMPPVR